MRISFSMIMFVMLVGGAAAGLVMGGICSFIGVGPLFTALASGLASVFIAGFTRQLVVSVALRMRGFTEANPPELEIPNGVIPAAGIAGVAGALASLYVWRNILDFDSLLVLGLGAGLSSCVLLSFMASIVYESHPD